MKRDMAKLVEEYNKKFEGREKDAFRLSDIEQIKEMSKDSDPGNMYYKTIVNALEAGFMIGHAHAKRESRA